MRFKLPDPGQLPAAFGQVQQQLESWMSQAAQAGPQAQTLLRDALATALGRLDLVSRAEFDQQQALLAQAEARLNALEAQLAELQAAAATARSASADRSPK